MTKLEVFDPPMCCSRGVCGPKVDPALPRFAGDLGWVKSQGGAVKRYNLAQQPMAFADSGSLDPLLAARGRNERLYINEVAEEYSRRLVTVPWVPEEPV